MSWDSLPHQPLSLLWPTLYTPLHWSHHFLGQLVQWIQRFFTQLTHRGHFEYWAGFSRAACSAVSNLQLYKSMASWNLRRFVILQCLLYKVFIVTKKITSPAWQRPLDSLYVALGWYHLINIYPHFQWGNLEFRLFNPFWTFMSYSEADITVNGRLHRDVTCMSWFGRSYLWISHSAVYHCITTLQHTHTQTHTHTHV